MNRDLFARDLEAGLADPRFTYQAECDRLFIENGYAQGNIFAAAYYGAKKMELKDGIYQYEEELEKRWGITPKLETDIILTATVLTPNHVLKNLH